MMSTKLKDLFIIFIKHNTLCWHKSTDNDEVFSLFVPTEIMNWTFKSIDFVYFLTLIIKYV